LASPNAAEQIKRQHNCKNDIVERLNMSATRLWYLGVFFFAPGSGRANNFGLQFWFTGDAGAGRSRTYR
jgi:hypothetical protein